MNHPGNMGKFRVKYNHMCIYVYICVYIYIYTYVCVCVCLYIYTYMRTTESRQGFRWPQNEMKSTYINNCDDLPLYNFKLQAGLIL